MSTVLVTGGTGLLGRAVATGLAAAGRDVRVLSRTADSPAIATGDRGTGDGHDAAVEGAAAVVHRASDPHDHQNVGVDGSRRLIDATRPAATPHLVFVPIVEVDRTPWGSHRAKADAGRGVAGSGLRWTTLRATSLAERSPGRVGSRSES